MNGTSRLAVDFGKDTFSGALALTGRDTNTSASVDFGSTSFSGNVDHSNNALKGNVTAGNGGFGNYLFGQFYGPQGNEIAGTFAFTVPQGAGAGANLNGAFAAVQK